MMRIEYNDVEEVDDVIWFHLKYVISRNETSIKIILYDVKLS